MISWYLNRLRTMSPLEMFHRFLQMATSRYEKYYHTGKPLKKQSVIINRNKFSYNRKNFEIYSDTINIFGKEFDYSEESIDWHKDIFSEKLFPLTFSKSINIRYNKDLSAKNVWEINRLQFLIFIALNYNHTKDIRYLNQFREITSSWIDSNPYLLGVNWYSNIEVNIRLIVWYYCWQLINAEELMKINPQFKEFAENKWIPSIYQHCQYSYKNPSRFSSSNNHLISEYAGLFIASSLWIFKESKNWNRYAKAGLEKEIVRQYSSNGINKEEAAEYIQFITDFFLLSYIVGEDSSNKFSDGYKKQLEKIFTYINNFIDISGNFPQYGDEDDGKCVLFDQKEDFNNFRSLLTSGSIIFNEPAFKSKSNGLDTKNLVLFGEDGISIFNEIKDQKSIENSVFYPDEGHFIFRKKDIDNEVYMHFDAAPLGYLSIAAHGHADALSFIMHIDGQPVLIDSGTYTYHTEPEWRKYFIGTLAHNTIRINKLNQATIAGPTLWLNHYTTEILEVVNGNFEIVKASHDGYKSIGITHTREIRFDRDSLYFMISDELKTDNSSNYYIEFALHIHPLMKIKDNSDNTLRVENINGKRGALIHLDEKLSYTLISGRIEPEITGWHSGSFMQKEPATTILCALEATGTVRFETKIIVSE
jgi:hypothetical protein